MFGTIVVPLDGSELAERALPYAVRFAAERGGRLVLVRAALGPPPSGLDWERQQLAAMAEANAYLASVAAKVATRVPVRTAPVYGHPADEILAVVRQFAADSVVMATHGRTGLAHLLYGSVAEAVVSRSPVPVLVVHARPGEAARGADLVVMATHGRTVLRRTLKGSVAGEVLSAGSVPVLLVSPAVSAVSEHQPASRGMVGNR